MVETPFEYLESQITELAGHLNAALCRWLLLVAEYDRREGWRGWGMASCAHWLNWKCGISLRTGHDHIRVARCLEELPLVRDTFSRGELSYSKVRAITRIATPETEEALVMWARHGTASHLERIVGAFRRQELREELGEAQRRYASQSLTYKVQEDGSYRFTVVLPPDDGARLVAKVEAEAKRIDALPDVDLTREARHAQAVVNLTEECSGECSAEHSEDEAEVVIHIDADLWAGGEEGERSHIEGGPAIPPETARRLGCSARVHSVIERQGEPIATTDSLRLPNRRQRRLLRARDHNTCQYPGCDRTVHLVPHHVRHYAKGGRTRVVNMVLLRLSHEAAA